jgi:hypothetical protein
MEEKKGKKNPSLKNEGFKIFEIFILVLWDKNQFHFLIFWLDYQFIT